MRSYLVRRLSILLLGSIVPCYPGFCQDSEVVTPKEFQKFLGIWQGEVDINEQASNSVVTSTFRLKVHSVQYDHVSFTIIKLRDARVIDSIYFKSSGAPGGSVLGLILPARLFGRLSNGETVLQLVLRNINGEEILRGTRGGLNEKETIVALKRINPTSNDFITNASRNSDLKSGQPTPHPDTAYAKAPEKSRVEREIDWIFRAFKSLSSDDRITIFNQLNISPDDINSEKPTGLSALRSDFNNDGILEVLIQKKSMNPSQIKSIFFVKPSLEASYAPVLTSTSVEAPSILLERNLGYNNLYINDKGVGKVFRWDGSKYNYYKTIDKSIIFKDRNTLSFDEANNHYYNKENFPQMNTPDILTTIEELKDLRGRNPNAKKGSPSKFIGGWWVMGDYKNPIFIKPSGSNFAVSDNKFITTRILSYNVKTDRLEGWVEKPGIKVKFVIEYNYDYDRIIIRPEAKEAGMIPVSLMRYKKAVSK